MITNEKIVKNMTADEKFDIICRINHFNKIEMAQSIRQAIKNSNYCDKDEYVTTYTYSNNNEQSERDSLELDYDMLNSFDDWAKAHMEAYDITYEECKMLNYDMYILSDILTKRQQKFIQLALENNVNRILI